MQDVLTEMLYLYGCAHTESNSWMEVCSSHYDLILIARMHVCAFMFVYMFVSMYVPMYVCRCVCTP